MSDDVCIAPHEIQEGDLLAHIDGETTMVLVAHIARCRFCQQELVALERMTEQFVVAYQEGEGKGNQEANR